MYNARSRLNVIVTHTLAVMALCAALMALSSVASDVIAPPAPTGSITAVPTILGRADIGSVRFGTRRPIDRTIIYVEGTADFTACFTWNTKQLFVFVVAEYTTSRMKRNQMTIYDLVIPTVADAKVVFPRVAEYYLDDFHVDAVRGANVTIKLMYHIMTYSGYAPIRELTSARTYVTMEGAKPSASPA